MENNHYIKELILRFLAADENAIAYSLYDGVQIRNISYPQFAKDILRASGYFLENNIHGKHIALLAPNSYHWIVVFFGILCSGNVAVPLNPELPREAIRQQCDLADVSILCGDTNSLADLGAILQNWDFLDFNTILAGTEVSPDTLPWAAPDDTAVMIFTSGTTGESKIVTFTMRNLQTFSEDTRQIFAPYMTSILLCLPLYHIYGIANVLVWLENRRRILVGRGMRYILSDMPLLNPSFVSMVPSVLESIVKILKRTKTEEERQKYIGTGLTGVSIGGAGIRLDDCRYIMDLGIHVQSAYGMTESAGAGTWCEWDQNNIGSIGRCFGRTICRIENGEILIKGPAVMKGYYKDPDETAKIIVDGWLHTGDLGYCDENGYFYITGRKKNVMILSNGENVNPEEIEGILGKCSAIPESLVYNDARGICADIYTQDRETAEAFIKAYNESVPKSRQLYKVSYSSGPLPKTGSGKIKRKENTYV